METEWMSLTDLMEYIQEKTSFLETTYTITRWDKANLLGNVPLREGGKVKDWSSVRDKAVVITLLRHLGWNYRKIRDLFNKPMGESKKEMLDMLSKATTCLSKVKVIINSNWEKIYESTERNQYSLVEETRGEKE